VIALSGGLCGSDEELEKLAVNPAVAGVPFLLGCSDEDSHVPKARVAATVAALSRAGANVQHDFYPGSEHKIFPTSSFKARAIFSELVNRHAGVNARDPYTYIHGYNAVLQSEALPNAVPTNQRAPHHVPYNLYAECITGSPFCAPRAANLATWLYRIHPSVGSHGKFTPLDHPTIRGDFCCPGNSFTPEPVRWDPLPKIAEGVEKDWVEGLVTIAGTGNPMSVKGMAIHTYNCNKSMIDRSFYDSDGDLLVVPELGILDIQTEFGKLRLTPGEIFILPRGLKMSVVVVASEGEQGKTWRGVVCELFEASHFQLPNLGPLGTNGLADPRHFKVPTATYEDRACPNYQLISKFGGDLFLAHLQYSPYDVVGWSGRYHPCKYNLLNFMAFGSVTWDHADPSLHTVLTCPIDPATSASACDIVCFRSRYDAVRHTFRPPYYHRNLATEFNFIVEMKAPYSGFSKGCHWLTPCMTAHGISGDTFNAAMARGGEEGTFRVSEESIWMMFESVYPMILTDEGAKAENRQPDYPRDFFVGVPRAFTGPREGQAGK